MTLGRAMERINQATTPGAANAHFHGDSSENMEHRSVREKK
jgi:hypothetical protein